MQKLGMSRASKIIWSMPPHAQYCKISRKMHKDSPSTHSTVGLWNQILAGGSGAWRRYAFLKPWKKRKDIAATTHYNGAQEICNFFMMKEKCIDGDSIWFFNLHLTYRIKVGLPSSMYFSLRKLILNYIIDRAISLMNERYIEFEGAVYLE